MKALLDDNIMAPWRGSEPAAVILGELEISPALPEEMRRVATLLNDEHYLGAVCRGQSTDLACNFSYHPRGLLDRCVEGGLGTPGAVITECIYDAAGRLITRSNGACTRTVTRAANGETLLWGSCVREVISDASSVVLSAKLVSRDANPQPITCTEGYSVQVQQKTRLTARPRDGFGNVSSSVISHRDSATPPPMVTIPANRFFEPAKERLLPRTAPAWVCAGCLQLVRGNRCSACLPAPAIYRPDLKRSASAAKMEKEWSGLIPKTQNIAVR